MIFRSPFPDVHVPEVSLTEFVFQDAARHAGKVALVEASSGRSLTYAQLTEAVRRAASGLAARGFGKGDVLGVLSPNLPEYAVTLHAVSTLGGVTSPVNPLYTAEEVARQLKDAGARSLVTVPQLLEKAKEAAAEAGVAEVFVFGEAEGATPFAALLEEGDGRVPDVKINPREDLAVLPYSSGTTGASKGVMLTHRNMVANLAQVEGTRHACADDTLVCVLPLFHIYGMQVILNFGLYKGATVVTVARFDLEALLKLIEQYRVTLAHLVPPIILALAKSPLVERYDLSSVKTVFSGAAPLGVQVAEDCCRRLSCNLRQGYGMTETSPVTHMTPPDADADRPGSVGVVAPNTECKLVDIETGRELGVGEEGEICVRGPQVMKGYLNNAEATANTIDAEGWLHTGDIGYADESGHFFVVDRAKELIKYKGFQVAPAELEALLLSHPKVADAAVIPFPDEEAGEVPKAFVVPRDSGALSEDEIIAYVAEHVAPHKKVRKVEFIEQIPKSPSGKILRRVLKDRERAQAERK